MRLLLTYMHIAVLSDFVYLYSMIITMRFWHGLPL